MAVLQGSRSVGGDWLPALRRASSAGEPLNPSVAEWLGNASANGVRVRDQYGQSEVGMVVVDGWHPECSASAPTPAYSMGHAESMIGHTATVVIYQKMTEDAIQGLA